MEGAFSEEELGLALRHVSMPLEALRFDPTPVGLHYTLSHFDIPESGSLETLRVEGAVTNALALSLRDLQSLPARTLRVTLECAGNGRAGMTPRYPSMPWTHGAVGTAQWTGTPLVRVLERAGLLPSAVEVAFHGADRGFDSGVEHAFARSLSVQDALRDEVLLAWGMNGQPLAPQHGAPLRLVVPGWFGMASVKWLERIEVLEKPFDGYQQVVGYRYSPRRGEPGQPVRHMKVKSLLRPPGIPDWYTGRRLVEAGSVLLEGRAWSGGGTPVARVEVAIDGQWSEAELLPAGERFAWCSWRFAWQAAPGEHEIACRATGASGAVQPEAAPWNVGGMGNNGWHRTWVTVR